MDSRENVLTKLLNHSIFKTIKKNLGDNYGNLKNLIEYKNDILYVWHERESNILTLNLKSLEEDEILHKYQTLKPMSTPSYEVERLSVGAASTRICLWGKHGVTVVELPARWGKAGLFDGGKETVLCKSFSLDERLLLVQVEVRRVHWHSSSLSHLLVLLSDNTIRLYNVASRSNKLVRTLKIGPKPSGKLAGRELLDSLGDVAVDFALFDDNLVILRGNGDVYMMRCHISDDRASELVGPLTMYPPADDNYGEESCAITILGDTSKSIPLVVIATCTAVLYHCLLIAEPLGDDKNVDKSCEYSLYVVEAVELAIILSPDETMPYSYPVDIYPNPSYNDSYVCAHAAGVHTVTLPIMSQVGEYLHGGQDDAQGVLSGVCSRSMYVVCTHGPNQKTYTPPIGVVVLDTTELPTLLVLLNDSDVVTRTLEPYNLEEQLFKEISVENTSLDEEDINRIMKERQRVQFTTIIQEMLSRDVSQPLLKVARGKDEPTPHQCLEFLSQATLKLNNEYLAKQERAYEAIKKKLESLKTIRKEQVEWFRDVQCESEDVRTHALKLKDRLGQIEQKQEELKERCWNVVRCIRASMETLPAERTAVQELYKHKQTVQTFINNIDRIKQKMAYKKRQLQDWEDAYKKKEIFLGRSHSDTISSVLQQQTDQITRLVNETKELKDLLTIS